MKTHESTTGKAYVNLQQQEWIAQPKIFVTPKTGETRPLRESDTRFVQHQRYAPVIPQLRLERLGGSVPQDSLFSLYAAKAGLFGLYTAPPTKVSEITVSPMQFLMTARKLSVDSDGLLNRGIVPINVSDLDGTLWKDPIADILVYGKLCNEKLLKPVIRDKLTELLSDMGLEPTGLDQPDKGVNDDVLRAKAWFDEHKGGFAREQLEDWSRKVYPLTSWSLAGFSVKEVQDMTRDIVRKKDLKNVAFRGARAKVVALKRAGLPTALFSASNTILAQAAVDEIFGGKNTHLNVVGTDVRVDDNGILTTEVINGGPCFRENKLAKVKSFLRKYVAVHHPRFAGREMIPLLASGDSPSKTDEQMMEYAAYACADEPGTKRDVEIAMKRAQSTGRYFILDFLKTVGGEPADNFRVDRPFGGAAGAL